jgi:hypothetical protein
MKMHFIPPNDRVTVKKIVLNRGGRSRSVAGLADERTRKGPFRRGNEGSSPNMRDRRNGSLHPQERDWKGQPQPARSASCSNGSWCCFFVSSTWCVRPPSTFSYRYMAYNTGAYCCITSPVQVLLQNILYLLAVKSSMTSQRRSCHAITHNQIGSPTYVKVC